jgi:hypothetical protein
MGGTPKPLPTAALIQHGPLLLPYQRIAVMSPTDWEHFTSEWAGYLSIYKRIERHAGAGDKGIDVRAFASRSAPDPWDNYQCKHYGQALMPTNIWVELGKVLHYTYIKEYSVPRMYYFVAPGDVGSSLARLLKKPEELRSQLKANWKKYCEDEIAEAPVKLEGAFEAYVDGFDMTIFTYKPVAEIIEDFRKTPLFGLRFGGGLPGRTPAKPPPAKIGKHEATYVNALLSAYGEHKGKVYKSPSAIPAGTLRGHFERSRRQFYCAEALREFSRDNLPGESYPQLEDQVHAGVVDIAEGDHEDGFACVKAVVNQAMVLQIDSHPLKDQMEPTDRAGICHQLANNERLKWKK